MLRQSLLSRLRALAGATGNFRRGDSPGAGRPFSRRMSGLGVLSVLSLLVVAHFTGCANHSLQSGILGVRNISFEQASARSPALNNFAVAFDEIVSPPPPPEQRAIQLNRFAEVFEMTRKDYVDPIDGKRLVDLAIDGMRETRLPDAEPDARQANKLITAAMRGMLQGLDAHSDYLAADAYKEMQVRTRGEFGGIGIEVTLEDGRVKVVSPIDDTPGARAGLQAGDLVTHVDGVSIVGKTLSEAVDRMRGPVGTPVKLRIERASHDDPLELSVVRDVIRIKSVRYRAEGDVGYIRVTTFNERTEAALYRAIAALEREIGDEMAGIVLDLRNNPGGLLDQALAVSDAFLTSGTIVSTAGRSNRNRRTFSADKAEIARDLPVMVLINGGSASASEIVAGALQDHHRGELLGSRSFGKGSVQTIIPVRGGGALRLTTARYYTPSGRSIQLRGIEPDIIAVVEEEQTTREADLDNALGAEGVEALHGAYSLEEACPSVAEAEDPVLACAFDRLRASATRMATTTEAAE